MKSPIAAIAKFMPLIIFGIFGIALVLIGVSLYVSSNSIEELRNAQIKNMLKVEELERRGSELKDKLIKYEEERKELNTFKNELMKIAG